MGGEKISSLCRLHSFIMATLLNKVSLVLEAIFSYCIVHIVLPVCLTADFILFVYICVFFRSLFTPGNGLDQSLQFS